MLFMRDRDRILELLFIVRGLRAVNRNLKVSIMLCALISFTVKPKSERAHEYLKAVNIMIFFSFF